MANDDDFGSTGGGILFFGALKESVYAIQRASGASVFLVGELHDGCSTYGPGVFLERRKKERIRCILHRRFLLSSTASRLRDGLDGMESEWADEKEGRKEGRMSQGLLYIELGIGLFGAPEPS